MDTMDPLQTPHRPDPPWTPYGLLIIMDPLDPLGLLTDPPWTPHGLITDPPWTPHGPPMDSLWTPYGLLMDPLWTPYGLRMDPSYGPLNRHSGGSTSDVCLYLATQ